MKITFCGGAQVVTGVNYLLETKRHKFLVDCGLFQGTRKMEKKNKEPFPYDPKKIDFVLVTHSHLDHIGRLPRLIKEGFSGKIYLTPPTADFTKIMLEDSLKLLEEKAAHAGVILPFTEQDITEITGLFEPKEYSQWFEPVKGISVCFRDAGHILGSAIIEIKIENNKNKPIKLIFSGDLGNYPVPILKDPSIIEDADYVFIESTYGDRNHESEKQCKDMLEDIIEEAIKNKGVLMIPSFALERSQQLLYHLNEIIENHRVSQLPIFFDSPLAIKATEIYKYHRKYFDKEAIDLINSGDDLFRFPGLKFISSVKESKKIVQVLPPKIIIAGSGMSQGGRIIHHEALYLSDPQNILLFISYQAKGTLGRLIKDGVRKVRIIDQIVPIRAKIRAIEAYSAHADQNGLIKWLSYFIKPVKKIFIVQGEEEPAKALARRIMDELGILAEVPQIGQISQLS